MTKEEYDESVKSRILKYSRVAVDGCWQWIASKNQFGYAQIFAYRKRMRAHRVSYQLFRGQIAEGMTIDHLCRNKACVNPAHMEVVTAQENCARKPVYKKEYADPKIARRRAQQFAAHMKWKLSEKGQAYFSHRKAMR